MQDRVCLIVPCYNEAARLDLAQFEAAAAREPVWFLFVDDGSTDGTADVVRRRANDRLWLVALDRNVGKAEAVRQGMLRAAGLPFYAQLEWVGFWDVDLSTPLDELPRFLEYRAFSGVAADAVFGSRVARLGSRIRRRPARHVLGRLFVTLASLLLGTRAYDSQCGAKIFRTAVVPRCFGEPFVTRWLFDLEILLRLGDEAVLEYPLRAWHDVPGSKLRLLPNVWRTLRDLARLRARYPSR
jgi:glycosyltransferase involved in cell wall biosynthesis